MFFNALYEFVTWTGLELTGVDFPGKFEKINPWKKCNDWRLFLPVQVCLYFAYNF